MSSWLPGKSISDGNSDGVKKDKTSSFVKYLLSWRSVKTCGYCDRQLPTDGSYTTCSLCKEGFHIGVCSDRRSSGRVKKLVKKFSCPECFSWKVGGRESVPEMARRSQPHSATSPKNAPLHKHMKDMFKPPETRDSDFSSQENPLKKTRPF